MKSKGSSLIILIVIILSLVTLAFFIHVILPSQQNRQLRENLLTKISERLKKDNNEPSPKHPSESSKEGSIPLAMAFQAGKLTIDNVCDYPVVFTPGRNFLSKSQEFESSLLDAGEKCGTKFIIALTDRTENIVGENGGLDLSKFRQKVSPFKGKIDRFVDRGVIIANGVVDEPHDCVNDWKGVCPKASEVDQASAISKEFWPNLPTVVNTIPSYLSREGYKWVNTDIVMFQYAYHKGDLNTFVNGAIEHLNKGTIRDLAWAMQVKSGGCPKFKECSMTPDQVRSVASVMCSTAKGKWIGFVLYDEMLLTPEMFEALEDVKNVCK